MENQFEKQGYLLEDYRLFHLKSAAGVRTEYHYHEFCKILLLISGGGSYWVAGQRYSLQPGDAVVVGSHVVHKPEFDAGVPYERIILYISPEFLQRQSTADCDLLDCFGGSPVLNGRPRLLQLAQELEQTLSSREKGRGILGNALLLQMLVELLRHRDSAAAQPMKPVPDSRMERVMAYIQDHLEEELTVESIAARFYLSKFHMMRLFRAATGDSVTGYITRQRLLRARALIDSGMSATESCFRSGFGSYSSFTRACGKYLGTTPTGRPCAAQMPPAGDE